MNKVSSRRVSRVVADMGDEYRGALKRGDFLAAVSIHARALLKAAGLRTDPMHLVDAINAGLPNGWPEKTAASILVRLRSLDFADKDFAARVFELGEMSERLRAELGKKARKPKRST